MQFSECKVIWLSGSKICFGKRCVDDVFLVANNKYLTEISEKVNSIGLVIPFTVKNASDCKFPFYIFWLKEKKTYLLRNFNTSTYFPLLI